jgi:hypothetical protein
VPDVRVVAVVRAVAIVTIMPFWSPRAHALPSEALRVRSGLPFRDSFSFLR